MEIPRVEMRLVLQDFFHLQFFGVSENTGLFYGKGLEGPQILEKRPYLAVEFEPNTIWSRKKHVNPDLRNTA